VRDKAMYQQEKYGSHIAFGDSLLRLIGGSGPDLLWFGFASNQPRFKGEISLPSIGRNRAQQGATEDTLVNCLDLRGGGIAR
jgi:hypothetical protein